MLKERHKEVPAGYVLLMKDGKVLLQRRCNTGYMDGKYSLPAGHVDPGETFTQCIIREAKEEISVDLIAQDMKFVHLMHRDSRKDYPQGVVEGVNERIDVFFTAEKWEGEPKIMEPDKSDDLAWFDLDKLPENTIPYIKKALENIKNKVFYSELGWNNQVII